MLDEDRGDGVVSIGENAREILDNLEAESPVIASFRRYSTLMKSSQDKYERIFKVRRDITIESKRVIFLLHTVDRESKKAAVFKDAEKKLKDLVDRDYKKIGQELEDEDPYRYHRVISPGTQEFIEALTLLEYMQTGQIKGLTSCADLPFVTSMDYVLGLADLTGELMRRSVASIGTGDVGEVPKTRHFLQEMYIGMMGLTAGRDLWGKLSVLKASLLKVERICYNLHVLGTEVPKHILTYVEQPCDSVDEGFQT